MIDWGGRHVRERRSIGAARGGGPLTSHHALSGRLDWLALGARPASRRCRTQWRPATCGEQCSASSGGIKKDAYLLLFFTFYVVLTGHVALSF